MIYPNKPLYLLSLLGYIYCLTYYTLTTKDNIDNMPLYHYFVSPQEHLYPTNFCSSYASVTVTVS